MPTFRGRHFIDRIKRSVGRYLQMPVPPYENPNYWEQMYKSSAPNDVFEWGDLLMSQHFLKHSYQLVEYQNPLASDPSSNGSNDLKLGPSIETTLGETIGVHPREVKDDDDQDASPSYTTKAVDNSDDEPVLVLGCGNSQFGEELLEHGWKGPIVQVDVSSRIIESMSLRCQKYLTNGDMILLQDDATMLSALDDNTVHAIFDKGLADAIFCTDDFEQCREILTTGHRVLMEDGVFCTLSYSRPEFFLNQILVPPTNKRNHRHDMPPPRKYMQQFLQLWSNIQIRKLDYIYLYRFVKAGPVRTQINKPSNPGQRQQQQQARRRPRR